MKRTALGLHRKWWPQEGINVAAPHHHVSADQAAIVRESGSRLTNPMANTGTLQYMQEPAAALAAEQMATLDLHAELQWTETSVMADMLPNSMLPSAPPLTDTTAVMKQQSDSPICTRAAAAPCVSPPGHSAALPTATVAALPTQPATPSPTDRPLHAAVFLTGASAEMLLLLVPALHPVVQADHMVVKLQPSPKDLMDLPVGAEVALQVVGVAADHTAQAALVMPPAWLACPDSLGPHIPLSKCASASEGHAGELLMHGLAGLNTCYHQLPEPFMVYGRLGVVTTSNQVIYSMQELLQGDNTGTPAMAAAHVQQAAASSLQTAVQAQHPSHTQPPGISFLQPQLQPQPQLQATVAGTAWAPPQSIPRASDFPSLQTATVSSQAQPEVGAALVPSRMVATPQPSSAKAPISAAFSATAASTATPPSASKVSLKDFLKPERSRAPAPPLLFGGGQGKPRAETKDGQSQHYSFTQGLGSEFEGSFEGSASRRVCWLQELGLGDYIAVAPLVAPATKSSVSQHGAGSDKADAASPMAEGFIEEFLADEPYQPQGVMARLHDNTLGYVAKLVAKRGPAAAEAAKAHARWRRQQQDMGGDGNDLFAARPGQRRAQGEQQQQQATAIQLGNTGAQPCASASAAGASLDCGTGNASTTVPSQQDSPACHAWEQYVQQYGEALTSAVLDDCGGDKERAVRTLDDQAALLGNGSLEALDELVARAVHQAGAVASSRLAAEQEQDRRRRAARQAARSHQHVPSPVADTCERAAHMRLLTPPSVLPSSTLRAGVSRPSYGSSDGLTSLPTTSATAQKTYHVTADDELEPARGPLLRSNWRAAALQGRAAGWRNEAPSASPQKQSVPSAGSGAFPPLKLLVRPDSLATTAAQAGQHIRSAELLKSLLPGYSSQAVVAALAQANGDVNSAADLLLASGPPTDTAVAQAAVAAAVVPLWDGSSTSSSEDEGPSARARLPQGESSATSAAASPASERSAKIAQLLQSFEGLDRSLAEFLLRQCGGDVVRTSRYILEEVLGRSAAAPSAATTAAVKVGSQAPRASANGAGSNASTSGGGTAPSPARNSRSRPTWETVSQVKPRPRRRVTQYVVGDDTLETDTARQSARLEADQERRVAQVYYDARNVFFQRAAAAYSAGDGRLAADLSRKGREMSHLAHKHRDNANEAAYRASNTSIRNQYVIDLHYLYVEEALGMLRHTVSTLEALNTPQGLDLKVITGIGHHSANNIPVIKNAVMAWLKEKGTRFYLDPSNDGVVCVHVGAM